MKQWYVVPFLPLFNMGVFFIRFAGIINSINTSSSWKTQNLSEEKESFMKIIHKDFAMFGSLINGLRKLVNMEYYLEEENRKN